MPSDLRNHLDEVLAHSESMVTGRRYFSIYTSRSIETGSDIAFCHNESDSRVLLVACLCLVRDLANLCLT